MALAGSARLGMAGEFDPANPIPEPERFFAGGDTTVRGFALDTLGIRHTPLAVDHCADVPSLETDTIDSCGFPKGGNAETIFNVELRGPVHRGLQGVGFVDLGNVFAH